MSMFSAEQAAQHRMASWKLTQEDRANLSSAILQHRFAATGVKLAAEEAALAAKCFEKAFAKADRTQMEALPDGWLPTICSIRVQFAGRVQMLDFAGREHLRVFRAPLADPVWRRVPSKLERGVLLVVEATERLGIAHEQHQQAVRKAREDLSNLARQIDAVMSQATTSGKLITLWPEVEPFIASMRKRAPAKVPAVPIVALNKMLGLPVGGQAKPKAAGR